MPADFLIARGNSVLKDRNTRIALRVNYVDPNLTETGAFKPDDSNCLSVKTGNHLRVIIEKGLVSVYKNLEETTSDGPPGLNVFLPTSVEVYHDPGKPYYSILYKWKNFFTINVADLRYRLAEDTAVLNEEKGGFPFKVVFCNCFTTNTHAPTGARDESLVKSDCCFTMLAADLAQLNFFKNFGRAVAFESKPDASDKTAQVELTPQMAQALATAKTNETGDKTAVSQEGTVGKFSNEVNPNQNALLLASLQSKQNDTEKALGLILNNLNSLAGAITSLNTKIEGTNNTATQVPASTASSPEPGKKGSGKGAKTPGVEKAVETPPAGSGKEAAAKTDSPKDPGVSVDKPEVIPDSPASPGVKVEDQKGGDA